MSHSIYSCHSDTAGPSMRGKPSESLVQSGWKYQQRGDHMTREPVMVSVRTDWTPMLCGALKQSGRSDPNCIGCVNRREP